MAFPVRVLLQERMETGVVSSAGAFFLDDGQGREFGNLTRLEFSSAGLSLMDAGGNSTALKAMDVRLYPGDPSWPLLFNDRPYRGEMRLILSDGKMDLVNVLDLEDYLCGVLPGELRTSAAEAEKVQAIVARTYAVGKALKSRKRTYDLRSTSADQVYGGSGVEDPFCNQAVEETRGLILAFQGKLAGDVFYHSTCGGSTESAEVVFRGRPVEYLMAVPCTMEDSREELCSFSRYFRWSVEWKKEELDEILKTTLGKSIGHVQTMQILSKGPSGRVSELEIKGDKASIVLKGEEIRRFLQFKNEDGNLRPLYSTRFDIEEGRDFFRLAGSGWGHGVGLCQMGAIGMARKGASSTEILKHYFPGVEVAPLSSVIP